MTKSNWSKSQDDYLRKNYLATVNGFPQFTSDEIAASLNKTRESIFYRAWVLGLKRPYPASASEVKS